MAISIEWATGIITVPQADLTDLGGGVYDLDIDWFRKQLNDLQDDEEGMPFPTTHNHNPELTVGGVTLARAVELINGYTVTFEDVGSPYAVNLTGANSNIADVTNVNNVSVRPQNSAGLAVVEIPSPVSPSDLWDNQPNERIDNEVYEGCVLTSARVRHFPDKDTLLAATPGGVAEGETATFMILATAGADGETLSYRRYRVA